MPRRPRLDGRARCWLTACLGLSAWACSERVPSSSRFAAEPAPAEATPTGRANPCRGWELPAGEHYVAPGLCARAVALDQGKLRQISFAQNGDLLGVRGDGSVLRYRDLDGNGVFEGSREIRTLANTAGEGEPANNGNNAHLDEAGGFLYAGSPDGVVRWPYSSTYDELGEPEKVVVNQPSTGTHALHTVHVYDGWLYVHSGSEDNFVAPAAPEYDQQRSVLKRFQLAALNPAAPFDWTTGETFASGIRNMVGFTRDAQGRLFGVVNGIDQLTYGGTDVHLDNPGEDVLRLEQGRSYGYPYCFTAVQVQTPAGMAQPGTQLASGVAGSTFSNPHDDAWCAQSSAGPETFLPAHSAPLDITFYEPSAEADAALPGEWRGGAFVTQHGSWNDEPSTGHRVVLIPFSEGSASMPSLEGSVMSYPHIVVFGGGSAGAPTDGVWGWSNDELGEDPVRPVGVAVSPVDGALYVSSDNAGMGGSPSGVLYRIGLPL